MSSKPTFFNELKRRNVLRAGVLYAGAVWALAQGLAQLLPLFGAYDWMARWFVIAGIIGFPFWLAFAWFYEFTPQGLKRESEIDPADSVAHSTGRKLDFWIIGVLAAAVVLLLTNQFVWHKEPGKAALTPAKSIAVLPFENLSADKDNAYFVAGMQDLILTKLADIGDLKVISRTSTGKYKSHPDNLKDIAQQLGVATILEGSVQKSGKQVLINVQLIDAQTDSHLWAEAYPRSLNNIFGVEGEVAQKVADALKARLTAAESTRVANVPTTNADAYTLYLKAEYARTQYYDGGGQPGCLQQARQYLTEAIAHDPRFAQAYAKLALVQGDLVANRIEENPELQRDSLANARKALALQPDLAEAHMVLGLNLLFDSSDNQEGLRELQTAARLAPNDASVPAMLAQLHVGTGDWQQASDEIARALRLDPRNATTYYWSALIDMSLRRYVQAQQILQQGLAISPQAQDLRSEMSQLMATLGQLQGALELLAQMPDQTPYKYQQLATVYLLLRDGAHAMKAAERIPPPSIYTDAGDRELFIADAALASGDRPRGAAALEKARSDVLAALQKHPDTPDLYDRLAQIEARRGQRAAALQAIENAVARAAASPERSRINAGHLETKAEILAYLGDAEAAVAILDKLLTTQGTGMAISPALLELEPAWDPIRHDPRFQALLKKYGDIDGSG